MITPIQFREEFPIFKEKIQLSSCSQSALHQEVKNSIDAYMQSWEHEGMNWNLWMEKCEQARSLFAKQINAKPNEVAIVSSVSHAAASISTSLEPTANRNKIVITDFDFPTIGHVWRAAESKFNVQFVDQNEHAYNAIADYDSHLTDDLLLFTTSHVNYYNGYKQNLRALSSRVHDKGGYLFVDAYQSFGQTPIDVKEMGIDFLAAGMQKYALGIPGIAFLYIKEEIAETLTPAITGWFGQQNPFAFDVRGKEYASAARRFDSGTFPMINGYAAQAALEVLDKLDMQEVEKHLEKLSEFAANEVKEAGLTNRSLFPLNEKGSNTAVFVENASEVEAKMAEKGFIVSARNNVIRIAPHYYNTEEDIRKAVQVLATIIKG